MRKKIIVLILLSMAITSSATTSGVMCNESVIVEAASKKEAKRNLNKLKNYILGNGYKNQKGNYVCRITDSSDDESLIVYNKSDNTIEISHATADDEWIFIGTMSIKLDGSKYAKIEEAYISKSEDKISSFKVKCKVDVKNYCLGDTLKFKIIAGEGVSDSTIQTLANNAFVFFLADFTDYVLNNYFDMKMSDIGFNSY